MNIILQLSNSEVNNRFYCNGYYYNIVGKKAYYSIYHTPKKSKQLKVIEL